jgi:hypothetical protein
MSWQQGLKIMKKKTGIVIQFLIVLWSVLVSGNIRAAGLNIGSEATVVLNDGQLKFNCTDLVIAGNLQVGTGTLSDIQHSYIRPGGVVDGQQGVFDVNGDWNNQGDFNPGTSHVNLQDGCSINVAAISGDNSFYKLSLSTDTGKQYNIESGSTQQIAVALSIHGNANAPLVLRSSIPGQRANLALAHSGSKDISYTNVGDIWATVQSLVQKGSENLGNTDAGNTLGWFRVISVPTLSGLGLLMLGLMLFVTARRRGFIPNSYTH